MIDITQEAEISVIKNKYGVNKLVSTLEDSFQSYLESQDHILDKDLIKERQKLFEEVGVLYQEPYIESIPSYKLSEHSYKQLELPAPAKDALEEISKLNVGIYPTPYTHQTKALEAFLSGGKDLIIATGTGSGKTESFLMPILGNLAVENMERPDSAALPGIRALLLYPMNALVGDQLSRIRKLFGNEEVSKLISSNKPFPVRFGAYNSRTPYPGKQLHEDRKNLKYFGNTFVDYYVNPKCETIPTKLKKIGKWPCKDMTFFYGAQHIEDTGNRPRPNWEKRLKTHPLDRELYTRHEIQDRCPEILITNYSMLEYMLMRPIEKQIFDQTKTWLNSHPDNQLTLVLDEAHMYRGSGGAEVAFLLRRFKARLGVSSEQIRFILTSASLGDGSESGIITFASLLTGQSPTQIDRFKVITGEIDNKADSSDPSLHEAEILANFNSECFNDEAFYSDFSNALDSIKAFSLAVGWNKEELEQDGIDIAGVKDFLFQKSESFQPLIRLSEKISGKASGKNDLAKYLFGNVTNSSLNALDSLIALGMFAQRKSDSKVRLPIRAHLFYRGLPALYACINQNCNERRTQSIHPTLLGRLHTEAKTNCSCSQKGRVYELITHRLCGGSFLRTYMYWPEGEFLWHEPGSNIASHSGDVLHEVHLLVENLPHPKEISNVQKIWIDISTGKFTSDEPNQADLDRYLKAYIPNRNSKKCLDKMIDGKRVISFSHCPCCTKSWYRRQGGRPSLYGFSTKGEEPFSHLVKAQLMTQQAALDETDQYPNRGRKVLLFSDGRQKAARLARDIPRAVEIDTFRQAIALAVHLLDEHYGPHSNLGKNLYKAFIAICSESNLAFFDGDDHQRLKNDIRKYKETVEDNFDANFEEFFLYEDLTPPQQYYEALLRQLCNPKYSIQNATVGFVLPLDRIMSKLSIKLRSLIPNIEEPRITELTHAWIENLLEDYSLDRDIPSSTRRNAHEFQTDDDWSSKGTFDKNQRVVICQAFDCNEEKILEIEQLLQSLLTDKVDQANTTEDKFFLNPGKLHLVIDLVRSWWHCRTCKCLKAFTLLNYCVNCGSSDIITLSPTDEYIQSRKKYWRDPISEVISSGRKPFHITAEEHTAQLAHRDQGDIQSTTEKHELRFQDILLNDNEIPIDVLSCTTTMEVGIDIGSLVAVGLRNVPPQRENYQQRAGRAGRRGSVLSSVITYAQGGYHDSHYFHNPAEIVSGNTRKPMIKLNNEKIAKRHINAFLINCFFMRNELSINYNANLMKVLGKTIDFYSSNPSNKLNLIAFRQWLNENVFIEDGLTEDISQWLPSDLYPDLNEFVRNSARELLHNLTDLSEKAPKINNETSDDDEKDSPKDLIPFMLENGILPSYALPTDLSSFRVEKDSRSGNYYKISVEQMPQLSIAQALSEYAPGRLVVINKKTYRSAVVNYTSDTSERDRATALFTSSKIYIYCNQCSYVQDTEVSDSKPELCPICKTPSVEEKRMIKPVVFMPNLGKPLDDTDRNQDLTYASSAQFPVPIEGKDNIESAFIKIGRNCEYTYSPNRHLVMVNKGKRGYNKGFSVCNKCGLSSLDEGNDIPAPSHLRPYKVSSVSQYCTGSFESVFLGHAFLSDLLLIRLKINDPIVVDMDDKLNRRVLEDSLRTLSEALILAASRHLDIDPSEFNAGYRIVPGEDNHRIADLYLFDTLSGGAGYSIQAGECIEDIISLMLGILDSCPGNCERSCHNCLRHYANQQYHQQLDRKVAANLLRYAYEGLLPTFNDMELQAEKLFSLKRMLELENRYDGIPLFVSAGISIPLKVSDKSTGKEVAIGTYNGLIDEHAIWLKEHPVHKSEFQPLLINEYILSHDLPEAYSLLKKALR